MGDGGCGVDGGGKKTGVQFLTTRGDASWRKVVPLQGTISKQGVAANCPANTPSITPQGRIRQRVRVHSLRISHQHYQDLKSYCFSSTVTMADPSVATKAPESDALETETETEQGSFISGDTPAQSGASLGVCRARSPNINKSDSFY